MPTLRTIFRTILSKMTNVSTSNVHFLFDFHLKFARLCSTYPSLKTAPPPPLGTPMNLFIAKRRPLINMSPELL